MCVTAPCLFLWTVTFCSTILVVGPGSCLGATTTCETALAVLRPRIPGAMNWIKNLVTFWWFCHNFTSLSMLLPGHLCVLQLLVCSCGPSHSVPPLVLVLVWNPPPHVTLHWLYSAQGVQEQLTGRRKTYFSI